MSFLRYITKPDGSACDKTTEPLVLRLDRKPYEFPPLAWVEIDEGGVASWFAGKASTGPDPKAGNHRGVCCLAVANELPRGEKPARTYLFGPPPPPPPNPNRLTSPHGKPRARGDAVIEPPKDAIVTAEKKAIGDMNPDKIRLACIKLGVPYKGAEKATLVDALWSAGFRAPRE